MARKVTTKTKAPAPSPTPVSDSLFDTMSGYTAQAGFSTLGYPGYRLSTYEIEEAIRCSGVIDTFINRPAKDATSGRVTWTKLKDAQRTKVDNWLNEIGFFEAAKGAYQAMDRTGFAAIHIDTGSLDNAKEMRSGELRNIKSLAVYDADCLTASRVGYPVNGKPTSWLVANDPNPEHRVPEIHGSRLLIFWGPSPSPRARYQNGGKGDPKLLKVLKSWKGWVDVNETAPQIARTYEEPTMFIKDLNKTLGIEGGKQKIKARVTDFAITRHALRVAAMDAEEKYERPGPPLQGIEVIYQGSEDFFLNHSGWPRSILFSSLKGGSLGGDGAAKGEEQDWSKMIFSWQMEWLFGPYTQFFGRAKADLFKTFDLAFSFPPLHQETPSEKEDIADKKATRHASLKREGLLTREEGREALVKDELYTIDPKAPPDAPESDPGQPGDGEGKPIGFRGTRKPGTKEPPAEPDQEPTDDHRA